ncbi:TatD family hydrolase [Candidatus Peregrinibacteria bacterium]|nr:TatD family hydrolase [Candidatus Peregrinibacteria bacterium]
MADPQFSSDLDAVIARALAAGVNRMICIGDTIEESGKAAELAEKNEHIFCTVGVHPHHSSLIEKTDPQFSAKNGDWLKRVAELVRSSRKVRAIGETGLDYHYDFSPRGVQREAFRKQLLLARELHMPAVVHCRKAVEDVWKLVDEIRPQNLVIHCCTEKWSDVEKFVDRGYMLSFTGIATYPKSGEIRNTIGRCPLAQLMIETDAPFLAPVPHRGQRNEPAFVVDVAECVAEIKEISLKQVEDETTKNAVKFFGLPEQGVATSLP